MGKRTGQVPPARNPNLPSPSIAEQLRFAVSDSPGGPITLTLFNGQAEIELSEAEAELLAALLVNRSGR